MFDVTPDEIAQLNDTDLRELVGRLCEAELSSLGLSPAAVTWGGKQTAADGGLDVRVALRPYAAIDGFIARPSTGFQVKTPDMPRAAILTEMRPANSIRPVIRELADEAGAYIIVSSHGSTADSVLRNRRDAMREALAQVPNADKLHIDFYDRTRLASWVRRHPGLIAWVKKTAGRALVGWRGYGSWCGAAEGVESEYLLDDKLRLYLGGHSNLAVQPVKHAIDALRGQLAQGGKIVRLVGLSGVGKTRFVEALFDKRVGSHPLPPSLAVYTNLSDMPDPQPTVLASDLIANRARAVLIVDNCPPDLHRRLSEICSAADSTVSVLTVEYDVRDDQPEATQVVILDTASPELIERLVARRYPHVSKVDARTIADASGGNARIAIALAETVGRSESISGLSDDDLFQRLFRQRHGDNDALLLAAKACALVYSFHGEALTGEEAELPRLALLANQAPQELYRHVGELLRRDLVQQRNVWRAILPHAIANRLAAHALDDIPDDLLDEQLVTRGTERLARSFSRRLSFLHKHPRAIAITKRWLASGGLLGDLGAFDELAQSMFANVAPVAPEAALLALERVGHCDRNLAVSIWRYYRALLRLLAYDPALFERSCLLLVQAAPSGVVDRETEEVLEAFSSLFPLYYSGTHATIEQRLRVIEKLLRAAEPQQRQCGLAALNQVLRTQDFGSRPYSFSFRARSRDYGYHPKGEVEIAQWYHAVLSFIERLAFTEGTLRAELLQQLSHNFRALWTSPQTSEKLEEFSRRAASKGFWREGWIGCRQSLRFDKDRLSSESFARLAALEVALRPSTLPDRVRVAVLEEGSLGLDLEDVAVNGDIASRCERPEALAYTLGAAVATDETTFVELMPELLRGGNKVWPFGSGLASAADDRRETWAKMAEHIGRLPFEERNAQMLGGYLAEVWEIDRELAHELLDAAVDHPTLLFFVPVLHTAVEFDVRGIDRLKRALRSGNVPVRMFRHLVAGGAMVRMTGRDLGDLLLLMMEHPDGAKVALGILSKRLFADRSMKQPHDAELIHAGQEILRQFKFPKDNRRFDYDLSDLALTCLSGLQGGVIAAEIAKRLRQAVASGETFAFDNDVLLKALLRMQPAAVLDALFKASKRERDIGVSMIEHNHDHRGNPAEALSCAALIRWCEGQQKTRYLFAASFVPIVGRLDIIGPTVWSEQATALLSRAPDPRGVLAVFEKRFPTMTWHSSRDELIKVTARLFGKLKGISPAFDAPFLAEVKDRLKKELSKKHQWPMMKAKDHDESFE
ncbi:hypothetical protein [Rhizobium leguminosarum]|nr:hypothetical protein HB775_28680 [Rhizobium leguminosarum bv. trifolii]